jgi:hypothetical protein
MFSHIPHAATRFSEIAVLTRCTGAAILVMALAGPPDSCASASNEFIRLTTSASGGTPIGLVSADFNRDGKADVVAVNSNGVLSILLGNGTGGFAAPRKIATLPIALNGDVPQVFTGDFNGDSNPDLLVFPSPGSAVTIYPGRGDGSFAAPVNIGDGLSSAGTLVVGDFNGDGRADVAVTSSTSLAVLLQKPSGFFATPIVTVTNLSAPVSLAVALGDVNRDGHLDAAVTDQNGSFQILLGNGHGTFAVQPVTTFNLPIGPIVLAIADFNLDGKPDLVAGVGGPLPLFFNAEVCLLFGVGDGTFDQSSPPCYGSPDSFTQMQVTNLNGRAGLVIPSDHVRVLLNSASAVVSETRYAAGGGPVTMGDFNGDGRQDIVAGNSSGIQVLLNAGAGVLHAPIDIDPPGTPYEVMTSINTSDFNGDGFADLAVESTFNEHGNLLPEIGALLGAPSNRLNPGGVVYLPFDGIIVPMSNPPAIADFNHDGHLDMAFSSVYTDSNGQPVSVMQVEFGDGNGNFNQGPALPLSSNYLAAGNFNAGGFADLASLNGPTLEILLGKGDGTFAPAVPYAVGTNPVFVLQCDLNEDGKRDLIVVNMDSDDISILLGIGDGTFKPQKRFAAGNAPVAAATGDFNRDGKVDIAVAGSTGVSILLGNGNGTFQPGKTYTAAGPVTGIVQASVRQDGIESLLGIDSTSQRFALLPGVGNGTFGAPVFFPVDRIPTAILAADLNRDGAPDVVLLGNGRLAVFYNQGADHVALAGSSTKPKANQPVMFTAHVTAGFAELGAPTGKVTFKDGAKFLGNIALQGGSASITTRLKAGTHQIKAEYGGDSTFNPNHSATLSIPVAP